MTLRSSFRTRVLLSLFLVNTLGLCAFAEESLVPLLMSDGVLQAERTKLKLRIEELQSRGAGKPFVQSFAQIDNLVRNGASEVKIKEKVNRLKRAVANQLTALTSASASSKPRTTTPLQPTPPNDIEHVPYMADLEQKIIRMWSPPKGTESKRIMVVFKLHSNGTVSNIRLLEKSGVEAADQAALKAVETAAPFRPLEKSAPDDVEILFTFDYNRWKDSRSDK